MDESQMKMLRNKNTMLPAFRVLNGKLERDYNR